MPSHLAEIYANYADLALPAGLATLALAGVYFLFRRIFISAERRRLKADAYLSGGSSDDAALDPLRLPAPRVLRALRGRGMGARAPRE